MAKKKAKAKVVAGRDRLGAIAALAAGLSLMLTIVFIFCTSAELKQRPTAQQVLEGFKAVDARFLPLEAKKK